MQSSADKKISYRSDIDGLRTIAVLSVLAFHFFQGRVKGGFVGVDIFFVISGYLISSVIYKDLESDRFSIIDFYVRRIRRIYPALFMVLVFVCVAGWVLLLPTGYVLLGKQIIGGSTFVANFVLWWQSGYFSPDAAQKPLLNLWSLGVEEQFYLIFPLICIAFHRAKSRWALPGAYLALGIISMVVNIAFVREHRAAMFFMPFSRLWELLVGAGLSLYLQRNLRAPTESHLLTKWRTCIGFAGLAMLFGSIFGINQHDAFPGGWALLPTVGAAMVIVAGPSAWFNRNVLSCKPAVFVGLISYPLYLWHWPILSFTRIFTNHVEGHDIGLILKGGVVLLSIALAYLTYRFIEMPIREVKRADQCSRGALWLLGGVAMTGAFGVLVVLGAGFPQRLPSAVVALDHDYGVEVSRAWREGSCFLRTDQSASSFSDDCLDPAKGREAQPLLLVWGDSHAADLLPGFRALQTQSGIRLAEYTASLCAPILGLEVRNRPACASVNDAVFDHIRILKPDIVLLSAYWDYLDPDNSRAARAQKLLQTIELIKGAGVKRVVVIGSAPFWTSTVPGLLESEVRRNPNSPVPNRLTRGLLDAHDDELLKSMTERAGANFVPVFEDLCDHTSCIAITGSTWRDVVTYDNSHFTEHGSMLVAQRIWPSVLPPRDGTGEITRSPVE
jgi:peptidoglycan/LPS O-acetylase OafA/YrhL